MKKLIVLFVTLTALVAFATATATATVHTTIDDVNPITEQRSCSQRLQGQRLNHCRLFLMESEIVYGHVTLVRDVIQQYCCQELRNIEEPCQCEAVKQVYREVKLQLQQQQGPHFGPFGFKKIQESKQKAQALPNLCNLRSKEECRIGTIEGSNRF